MTIDQQTFQTLQLLLATILTPAVLSPMADTLAAILAQDGFPQLVNDLIAWLVLLSTAIGSVFVANQFTSNLSGLADVLIPVVFVLVNTSMSKLRPYLAGLDWIQSHVFDVAKGANGQPVYTFDPAKAWAALLPEIEGIFQRNLLPLVQRPTVRAGGVLPAPTKSEPQPILLPNGPEIISMTATPSLNIPVQWGIQTVPEPVPAVQPPPALPDQPVNNIVQLPTRHFGDTGIVPAVSDQAQAAQVPFTL